MMRISLWIPLLILTGALAWILRSDFSFKPYDKARETSLAPHFICDRKSDSLELVKLYNATGGSGWSNKWDLSKPITQWYGLSFTSDGCVQNISLQQNNLMGTWTDVNLPNLNFLDLRFNKLTGTIANFKNSPLLHTLKISHNIFYGNLPDLTINNRLLEFWVDDNNFNGLIPDFGANSPQFRLALFNDNRFTFDGIVQNQAKLTDLIFVKNKWEASNFTYAPQQKIYTDATILITSNTSYTLDLKIDDTVTTSTYTWYKNGVLYKTIKGSNKLPFASFTSADAGTYTLKISNSLAPQLTLESWPIRLVEGSSLVCDRRNDSMELVKFYNATGGANWSPIKWDLSKQISTWQGIQFNFEGCVTKIVLIANKLQGSIPDLVLSELQELSLINNKLSGAVPNFSNLPKLSQLNLRGNTLTSSIPFFNKCPDMGDIDLSFNQLIGNIPNFGLPKLSKLRLEANKLIGAIPNFNLLPNLDLLDLNSNQLNGSIPNFNKIPKLTVLNLVENQLVGTTPNFDNLLRLQYLELSHNELSGSLPNFDKLPDLLTYNLSWNQFTGGIPNFDKLPKLKTLDLGPNKLSGEVPNFDKIPDLQYLNLASNLFGGSLSNFNNLVNLRSFDIYDNKYTFTGLVRNIKIFETLISTFKYAPQQKIYSDTTILILSNTSYTLDLKIDDTITTSAYTWYKNGILYKTTKGSNKLSFTSFTSADNGTYTVKIANPLAPQLTLESYDIRLLALPSLVCDRRSDSLELVKFYNATGGPNWTTKWDLSKPINTWWGVELNSDGCVISLDQNHSTPGCWCGNNLVGFIPDLNLPSLIALGLQVNKLSGNIPNFAKLPNLETLGLATNELSGTIPNFVNLKGLKALYLNHNQLTGSIPNYDLPKLGELILYGNKLTGSIPDFDKLPKVYYLFLFENQLTGTIPNLESTPEIIALFLNNNQLSGAIPNFNLPKLKNIRLGSNQLNGVIPNFDKTLSLEIISFPNNKLSGSIPPFDKTIKLIDIDISQNQLTGIIPSFNNCLDLINLRFSFNNLVKNIPSFSFNSHLQILQLNDNKLTGLIPGFSNHKDLINLWLHNNELSGTLPSFYINNPKISFLTVQENNLTFNHLIRNISQNKTQTDIINKDCPTCNFDTLIYAPQKKIYTDTVITISPNSPYILDLKIDDTVTTSTYTWYKNRVLYKNIKGSNKLPFTSFTSGDNGTYTVKITNPLAPQLTLESYDIRLQALPALVCDRKSDSLELIKFYNATGGNNWWKKWDLSEPINLWWGISINSDGCVTEIRLNDTSRSNCCIGNNLQGKFVQINLKSLTYLNLRGNKLTGSIPDIDLPALQTLRLEENLFSGSIPDFSKLPQLNYLALEGNQLTGILPNFDKLPKLYRLGCYENKLTGSIPNFDKMPLIDRIHLSRNQFTGEIPNFDKMPLIRQINVDDNQLTGSIPNFNIATNLQNLNASYNQLSNIIPKFDKLPKFSFLYGENNKFTFSSIIPNLEFNINLINIINKGSISDTIRYAPQQKIYTDTTILFTSNTSYTLDLKIDDTVTTSTYTWYKNGVIYKTIKGSNKLPFAPLTSADAGTYTVKITNPLAPQLTLESWPVRLVANNCTASSLNLAADVIIVKYQTPALFDVLKNDQVPSNLSQNITIDNPLNGNLLFSNSTGKGTYTPVKGASGKEKLNYKVCLTDCPDQCQTSTIEFDVEAPCNDRNSLVLPNVIFPTGPTGANRYFIVEALKKCPDAFGPKPTKLTVFNRWGDVVYKSNDYQNNWEGVNTSGQPLPEGTYYYLLDLGSQSAPVKGYVVIMR